MLTGQLWSHSDFKRLWFGQSLSSFGDRISRIALPTLALLTLDASTFQVGLLAAFGVLPYLVLGPFAGLLADRVARRPLLVGADLGRLLSLLSLPLAHLFGHLTLTHLMIVAAVNGVLTVFFDVAYQSYIPHLVGREHIVEANGKLSFTRSAADVGGAALGGGLLQILGAVVAVVVDAVTFLVSAVSVLLVRDREDVRTASGQKPGAVMDDLKIGFTTIGGDGRLRTLMTATGVLNLGGAAASALVLVYAYQIAGLSPLQVGIAFGCGGIGLLVGASTAAKLAEKLSLSTALIVTIVASGLSSIVLATTPVSAAFGVLMFCQFVAGLANSTYNIHVLSLVAGITPFELLGRVGGTAMSVVHGSGALGAALGGTIGAALGVRATIGGAGALIIAVAVMVAVSPVRSIRQHPGGEEAAPAADQPAEPAPSADESGKQPVR
ncbi:MFS transporter [Kribbella endophytica]